jgi:ribose-phosphate pyrophosphokinase
MPTLVTPSEKSEKSEKVEKKVSPVTDEKTERKQRPRADDKFKIFSGTANEPLADEVCHFLGMQRGQAQVIRFKDGECYVQIQENVRGADVFVMQPTCRTINGSVDEHLMELMLVIDALKRASARRITAVIPYFGYARQDRKDKPRSPISSKLVADLLTTAGAHRALIVDLHTPQLQGFFNIPVDHLFASPVLVDHFRKLALPSLTVVSPDAGGVERARFFAKKVDAALAIVDKRRVEMNVAEIMHVIGDVRGRT